MWFKFTTRRENLRVTDKSGSPRLGLPGKMVIVSHENGRLWTQWDVKPFVTTEVELGKKSLKDF